MVKSKIGRIYKITDGTPGKIYIGSTCQLLQKRFASHHALKQLKYGFDSNATISQVKIVIYHYDWELINEEMKYIRQNPDCVNIVRKSNPEILKDIWKAWKDKWQPNSKSALLRSKKALDKDIILYNEVETKFKKGYEHEFFINTHRVQVRLVPTDRLKYLRKILPGCSDGLISFMCGDQMTGGEPLYTHFEYLPTAVVGPLYRVKNPNTPSIPFAPKPFRNLFT